MERHVMRLSVRTPWFSPSTTTAPHYLNIDLILPQDLSLTGHIGT
jgi:hypothetical protein